MCLERLSNFYTTKNMMVTDFVFKLFDEPYKETYKTSTVFLQLQFTLSLVSPFGECFVYKCK